MMPPRRWLILAIISSALLLIVIDMTVLYTALPTLTRELDASASQKLWIINIYALIAAGLLLGMGTLGDRLGHKRLFIGGLSVFGLFSLIAAFSPSASVLIGARGFLAVGAAMMMPATLAIVRLTFADPREQAMAFGIWASVASGGAAFGPVVGGLLLEHFWWGSVFLINVPIVLVALVLGAVLIPNHPGDAKKRWDWLGSLQVMIGLISLAYAVKELGKRAPSFDGMLVAVVLGALFLTLFIRRQRRAAQPMLDLALFTAPGFRNADQRSSRIGRCVDRHGTGVQPAPATGTRHVAAGGGIVHPSPPTGLLRRRAACRLLPAAPGKPADVVLDVAAVVSRDAELSLAVQRCGLPASRQPCPIGLDDWRCTDRFVQHHHAQRARR